MDSRSPIDKFLLYYISIIDSVHHLLFIEYEKTQGSTFRIVVTLEKLIENICINSIFIIQIQVSDKFIVLFNVFSV